MRLWVKKVRKKELVKRAVEKRAVNESVSLERERERMGSELSSSPPSEKWRSKNRTERQNRGRGGLERENERGERKSIRGLQRLGF